MNEDKQFVLDVVIPTYDRAEKLARCVKSILAADSVPDAQVRIVVIPDHARRQAFGVWNDYATAAWTPNLNVDGAGLPVGPDAFAYVCDDVVFEPNAFAAAITTFRRNFADTDGVLGFNQINIPPDGEGFSRSAMGMVGCAFASRYFKHASDRLDVFCPDYRTFHADAELGMYARSVKRFVYCPDAGLTHFHPAYYAAEMDATHKLIRDPAVVQKDRDTWNKRREAGLLWGKTPGLINTEE